MRLEQVLNEDHFARVVPGTTTGEEVRRLIGPPSRELDQSTPVDAIRQSSRVTHSTDGSAFGPTTDREEEWNAATIGRSSMTAAGSAIARGASVQTTQVYTHTDAARLRTVHRKFHPRG